MKEWRKAQQCSLSKMLHSDFCLYGNQGRTHKNRIWIIHFHIHSRTTSICITMRYPDSYIFWLWNQFLVGANSLLRSELQDLSVRKLCSNEVPCQWHFNLPAASHFLGGGCGKQLWSRQNIIWNVSLVINCWRLKRCPISLTELKCCSNLKYSYHKQLVQVIYEL